MDPLRVLRDLEDEEFERNNRFITVSKGYVLDLLEEIERHRDVEEKYHESVMDTIHHSEAMMGGIFKLAVELSKKDNE